MAKVWKNGAWTLNVPAPTQSEEVTEQGVYETPAGEIFVAKFNREHSHLYAKRLVETPNRVTENGEIVQFDFVYEAGAIFKLTPQMKMSFERAKSLMIKYGHCIVCGRRLKAAVSVERGIGPVCIKYFAPGVTA